MEVIGVEHHEHVRVDLVDELAHAAIGACSERLRVRRGLARSGGHVRDTEGADDARHRRSARRCEQLVEALTDRPGPTALVGEDGVGESSIAIADGDEPDAGIEAMERHCAGRVVRARSRARSASTAPAPRSVGAPSPQRCPARRSARRTGRPTGRGRRPPWCRSRRLRCPAPAGGTRWCAAPRRRGSRARRGRAARRIAGTTCRSCRPAGTRAGRPDRGTAPLTPARRATPAPRSRRCSS